MLKHVIMWQLKEEFSGDEKVAIKRDIKEGLEAMNGKIDGLESVEVIIEGINSSSADVMLITTIEESALEEYSCFPEHKKVAVEKIRPFVQSKLVMDYII